MLIRERFEAEYSVLYERYNFGTTAWAALASGILTGKFNDGTKAEGTRYTSQNYIFKDIAWEWYFNDEMKDSTLRILKELGEHTKEKSYTQAQLALAWTLANKDLNTLILGISKIEYIDDNFKALELYKKWDKTLEDKINEIKNINRETMANAMAKRQVQLGKIIHFLRIGHWHEPAQYGQGRMMVNGSVPGQDSYADSKGFCSEAVQIMNYYVQTEKRNTCFFRSFPIYLQKK